MRHPAAILNTLGGMTAESMMGKRLSLMGSNPYVKKVFRELFSRLSTDVTLLEVDANTTREAVLRMNDILNTKSFPWEHPVIIVQGAEHVFSSMSFPDDFPEGPHVIIAMSATESVYCPSSFIPVSTDVKGASLQDFIKWMLSRRGVSTETSVIRYLSSEYREDLIFLEKLLDRAYISAHPRKVLVMADVETVNLEWDATPIIEGAADGDESRALKEAFHALKTFHPKGIVTILIRRVNILLKIDLSSAVSNSQFGDMGDVKPWVWKQNQAIADSIPSIKLVKWALMLDQAYTKLSKNRREHRWILMNLIVNMSRNV